MIYVSSHFPPSLHLQFSQLNDFQFHKIWDVFSGMTFLPLPENGNMYNAETLFDEKLLRKQSRGLRSEVDDFGASINNYLKTNAEIDADFVLEINRDKTTVKEASDEQDAYKSILKNGGNTVSPTSLYHGFMEENY